jgi:hypothetical protein
MGSKTPATTTQTQSGTSVSNPWSEATPLLQGLISKYQGANTDVTAGQKDALTNLQAAAGGIPNLTPQAGGAVKDIFGNVGMLNQAYGDIKSNLGGIASGKGLNPYETPGFGDALSTLTNDITKNVKGVYAGSGRDPSGAGSFAGTLSRGLTQGLAPVVQSQFNTNMGNMLNANNTLYNAGNSTVGALNANTMAALGGAGMLPGIATAGAQAQLDAANKAQNLPFENLLKQLQAAGILGGMGGTTQTQSSGTGTQTPANDPMSNIIGGVTAGAGLLGLFSDVRLKEDIQPVGMLNDGQTVYSYRYKGDATPQIGLLAQEVEKHAPDAVDMHPSGYRTVRYDKATRKAAQMGMLAA